MGDGWEIRHVSEAISLILLFTYWQMGPGRERPIFPSHVGFTYTRPNIWLVTEKFVPFYFILFVII